VGVYGARGFCMPMAEFVERVRRGEAGFPSRGQATWVHFSPPCPGYSKSNRQGGGVQHVRGGRAAQRRRCAPAPGAAAAAGLSAEPKRWVTAQMQ
jgi:hypothetical protein